MSDRIETVKKFMELQQKGDYDAALELLTDDISVIIPMMAPTTGKQAVKASWERTPPSASPKVDFSEPIEEGDTLKMTASSPLGRVTMLISFSGDKISKVEVKMG